MAENDHPMGGGSGAPGSSGMAPSIRTMRDDMASPPQAQTIPSPLPVTPHQYTTPPSGLPAVPTSHEEHHSPAPSPAPGIEPPAQEEVVPPAGGATSPMQPFESGSETSVSGGVLDSDELLAVEEPASTYPSVPVVEDTSREMDGEQLAEVVPPRSHRVVLLIGVIVALGVLAGGVLFAWSKDLWPFTATDLAEPAAQTAPSAKPEPEPDPEAPSPEPLLSLGSTLSLSVGSPDEAQVKIRELLVSELEPGTATGVSFVDAESGLLMGMSDVLHAAGISLPKGLSVSINPLRYTVFVIDEPTAETNRLGFVVESVDPAATTDAAESWEETMRADTLELLRAMGYTSEIGMPNPFQSFERGEVLIRYANLPDASLALDYAIDRELGLFYFATSRDSMTAALEAR